MANPNPNTSGLKPPWKPGETGNKKGFNGSRAEKELLRLLKKEKLWPEWARTLAAKSIGPNADARFMAIFLRVLRQWPEQRKDETNTIDLGMSDEKTIYMAKRMMEIDAEYERSKRDSPPSQYEGVDQEVDGGDDTGAG